MPGRSRFTLDVGLHGVSFLEHLSTEEMMNEYRAGKRRGIQAKATVYVHGPNKNFVVLNESELGQFAESFRGQPFLQDHARTQIARGGTIIESKLEEIDGKKVIRQTIEAVKPWAIEGLLDRTVDRFSIGWFAEENVCTVCDVDFFDEGHKHTIYDIGQKDKKTGKTIQVLMRGLEGIETSAVTHPAISGTSTDAVFSQLQQFKESTASGASRPGAKQEDKMLEKIRELLGLSADTAEPEALAAIEKLRSAPASVPAALLTALGLGAQASTDEAVAKAYGMVPREQLETLQKELGAAKAEDLVRGGKAAGKITPAMEAWAHEFAQRNPAEFEKCLATMPVQVPPANPAAPITADPGAKVKADTEDEEAARLSGLSVEKYRAGKHEFLQLVKGGN